MVNSSSRRWHYEQQCLAFGKCTFFKYNYLPDSGSVPDPDPRVFFPPGSGSISHKDPDPSIIKQIK
jgi:hypothetical protein